MSFPSTPKSEPTPFAFDMSPTAIDPSVFQLSPEVELGQWPALSETSLSSRAPNDACTPEYPRQHQRPQSQPGWVPTFHPYYPFGPNYRPRSLETAPPPPPPCSFNFFHSPPDSTSPMSSPGYGVSPTALRPNSMHGNIKPEPDSDDGIAVSNHRKKPTPDDTRIIRIESEQRRRDELREGFRKLREALPHTSQRSSKANVLDRSVAHIQSVEASNHYLLTQLQLANTELTMFKLQNQELVHSLARYRQPISPESC